MLTKKAEVANLASNKIDFNIKSTARGKKGAFQNDNLKNSSGRYITMNVFQCVMQSFKSHEVNFDKIKVIA